MNLKHGTFAAYNNHYCRCELCREAHTARIAGQRARRIADYAAGVRGPKFHNSSTYINWGCRCETCVLDMQRVNRETTDRHAVYRRMAQEDRARDEARDP